MPTYAEHTRMLAVRDELLNVLDRESAFRDGRRGTVETPHGPEPAWMLAERQAMHAAVNAHRRERGLPEVDIEQVWRIEETAAGHSDYAVKYALRCAFLAAGLKA